MIRKSPKLRQARKILRDFKITHRIYWTGQTHCMAGMAMVKESHIVVWPWKTMTLESLLSTIMHEIGHILDYREGKYKEYLVGNLTTQKLFNKWARQALKAERSADKRGKKLLKEFFPGIKFLGSYGGSQGRTHIRQLTKIYAEDLGYRVPKN